MSFAPGEYNHRVANSAGLTKSLTNPMNLQPRTLNPLNVAPSHPDWNFISRPERN